MSTEQEFGEAVSLPEIEAALDRLAISGDAVRSAGWSEGLRDFQVELMSGRRLVFRDCLQASYVRPLAPPETTVVDSWWSDEPSPVITALGPEARFLYHHLVFEVGEGLLRVVFRRLNVDAG